MMYESRIEKSILDNYLIISIVNSNYLKIFDIWYDYFETSGYKSILRVITLDKSSNTHLLRKSIKTIYRKKSIKDFSKIILIRWEVIYELLDQGKNVINSDADAIWLKPDIRKVINSRFDIQVSIAYGIPVQAVTEWGFTLCTGFMVLQSNSQVKKFVLQWIKKCAEIGDDQIAFNNIFLNSGIKWQSASKIKNSSHSEKHKLKIEAINYNLVSRELTSEIIIFHPYLHNYHQNLKVIRLVKSLNLYKSNSSLKDIRNKVIYNPFSWIKSTYNWLAFLFYKAVNKLKSYY